MMEQIRRDSVDGARQGSRRDRDELRKSTRRRSGLLVGDNTAQVNDSVRDDGSGKSPSLSVRYVSPSQQQPRVLGKRRVKRVIFLKTTRNYLPFLHHIVRRYFKKFFISRVLFFMLRLLYLLNSTNSISYVRPKKSSPFSFPPFIGAFFPFSSRVFWNWPQWSRLSSGRRPYRTIIMGAKWKGKNSIKTDPLGSNSWI